MQIGVPKEIKPLEGRVSMIPDAVSELVRHGHEVLVQAGAGEASGYSDAAYRAAGAQLVASPADVYAASLIVKVKEPVEGDLPLLRPDHTVFSYLHLAALPALTRQLCDIGLTAIGFETLEATGGGLPLLAPMSDIAGRLALQIGANLLHRPQGGKGVLLGGLPGTPRGRVVILGAGTAGSNAALMAAGMGAEVVVFDRNRDKLARMRALGDNVTGLYAYADSIAGQVARADVLVGAVLVTGQRTPHLVSREQVASMQAGSVIIDISVDQGGCVETTRPTDYRSPTFVEEGVIHFGVTNMPGAVPKTASQALSTAIMPYVLQLATPNWRDNAALSGAVNVADGKVVHPALQV
ncbi:MAG: alanine dehydrogenase [Granulosicoccaceae bacterium]|jgi:alanine dehydrogenase